jgi:hypothetical protein
MPDPAGTESGAADAAAPAGDARGGGGPVGDRHDADLARLIARWPTLPPELRVAVLRVAGVLAP